MLPNAKYYSGGAGGIFTGPMVERSFSMIDDIIGLR